MSSEHVHSPADKGADIFHDIFRRADKNDDGSISWEEFSSYFADGVYSEDELKSLFNVIDSHNTNNIDTGELCSYFKSNIGNFQKVFGVLEDLNGAVNDALMHSSLNFSTKSDEEQFMARFFVREITGQLSAVNSIFENVGSSMDDSAKANRGNITPFSSSSNGPTFLGSAPKPFSRRWYRRQISAPPGHVSDSREETGPTSSRLETQIDRLEKMIKQMQTQLSFVGLNDEKIVEEEEEMLYVVRTKINIALEKNQLFRSKLKPYVEALNVLDDCYHISIRTYTGENVFIVYELWNSEKLRKRYMCSDVARDLRRTIVDCSTEPEEVAAILLPTEWWKPS